MPTRAITKTLSNTTAMDGNKEAPIVSVLLLNWNGRKIIGPCLLSIEHQDYTPIESIVIDCASSDGSVDYIRTRFPNAKVIALKEDKGSPYAVNLGVKNSNGTLIMIMNNDVILPIDTISNLVRRLGDRDKVLVPIELAADGTPRGAGWSTWIGEILSRSIVRDPPGQPFYPAQACLFTSRRLLEKYPYNENFFMYEDAEWGWRLNLSGETQEVALDVRYFHVGSQTKGIGSREQMYLYGKARIMTYYLCLKRPTLIAMFPLIAAQYAYDWITCARYSKAFNAFQTLIGFRDFLVQIGKYKTNRKQIQNLRKQGDGDMVMRMVRAAALNRWIVTKESRTIPQGGQSA